MEFVPPLGPLLFAAASAALAALQTPILAVWVCGFLAAVRLVEDYVVYPRLVGRGLHLHPAAVIVGVLAGLELGGLGGIFVAVPVIALCSVGVRHWIQWRETDAAGGEARPGAAVAAPH
jgi:predicted PurR-regulated permease PerM